MTKHAALPAFLGGPFGVLFLLLGILGCSAPEVDSNGGERAIGSKTEAARPFPLLASHGEAVWRGPTGTDESLLLRDGPEYPEVTFMIASDLHHLSPTLWDEGPAFERFMTTNDGKALRQGRALLRALAASTAEKRPEFLVVTGDLTTNGAVVSHREVAETFDAVEAAGIPVYAIPGNHDIANPWASSFLGAEEDRVVGLEEAGFAETYAEFGYRESLQRYPGDLSYTVEPKPGLILLMLDTNRYELNRERGYPVSGGAFSLGQRRWILSVLEEAAEEGKAVLAFSHHSFISHSGGGGYRDLSRLIDEWPRNTREFWDRAVPVMFTGHIHAQNIAAIRGVKGEWIYDIATGAFSIYPHSYRLLRITDEQRLRVEGNRLAPEAFSEEGGSILRRSKSDYLSGFVERRAPRIQEEYSTGRGVSRIMAAYPAILSINQMAGEEQPPPTDPFFAESRAHWERLAPERWERLQQYLTADRPPRDNDVEIDLATGMWRSVRN